MNVNEQSSEEAGTLPTEGESDGSSLQALGELLQADFAEPTSGDDSAESSGSDEQTTPTKFNDLAGAMGGDLDALYSLGVQIEGVDDPVSVEALKDHYKDAHDFDLRVLEFEERVTSQQSELVRAKSELQEILSALPANAVKPEVLEKIRMKAEANAAEQRALTLDAIPSWQNDEARASDLQAMSEHLQNYGFPVEQLASLVDHRWQRYIRDNMLRERRVREALAKVRAGNPEKSGSATPQGKAPSKRQTPPKPQAGQSKLEATLSTVQ